jgi:hypothetical protein
MLVCELLDDLEPSEIPFYRLTHSVKMESENWTSPSRTMTVQKVSSSEKGNLVLCNRMDDPFSCRRLHHTAKKPYFLS